MKWISKIDQFADLKRNQLLITIAVLILSTLIFSKNILHRVDQHKFQTYENTSEAAVTSRVLYAKQHGLFADKLLLGWLEPKDGSLKIWTDSPWAQYQFDVFNSNDLSQSNYVHYTSQIGTAGLFFSTINKIFDDNLTLDGLHFINAILSALAVSLLFYFFMIEFGLFSAIFAVFPLLTSTWTTLFGKNLYWIMWSLYVPFLLTYAIYKYEKYKWILFPILFVFLLFRFGAGFEFTSAILVTMSVPLFYFAIKNNFDKNKFIKNLILLASIGIGAFFIAMLLWYLQLKGFLGSHEEAINTMKFHVLKRTYTDQADQFGQFKESLNASVIMVALQYFKRGFALFPIFVIISVIILKRKNQLQNNKALIAAVVVSFMGPISWFILAKGHSHIHTHINPLLWYAVFIPYANVLISQGVKQTFSKRI